MQEESFEVQYTQEGERLDKVLSEIYPDFSRSFFQKLIKNKQIQVNGAVQKASYPVHTEDLIRVTIPDAVETTIEPENIPLDIVYEDDDLLVVNKPKGMVVHPAPGHSTGTLVHALLYHCGDRLSSINGVIRPGIGHRIDRFTINVESDAIDETMVSDLQTILENDEGKAQLFFQIHDVDSNTYLLMRAREHTVGVGHALIQYIEQHPKMSYQIN